MSKNNSIHIGTSGWNYKHWKGNFYPEDIPQKDWFNFYSKQFKTVELNSSFYHLPKPETFEKWKEQTPYDFIFSVKASRYITHIKKLNDAKESVDKFIDNAKNLNEKLGPILFQLPPNFNLNLERFKNFLRCLSSEYRYTIEFRNETWWKEDVFEVLSKKNIAFCIYELGEIISPKKITADFVYVRFHGPGKKYSGHYSIEALKSWAKYFSGLIEHDKDVYCYFDNDENRYAAQSALSLMELLDH